MESSLHNKELIRYVNAQLSNIFPDDDIDCIDRLKNVMRHVLNRVELCFSKININYYKNNMGEAYFNHLNGDQYSMFLFILSNEVYKRLGDEKLASKLFLLNKAMFGIDAFYKIELPDYFMFVHPVGTVLGNAVYNDYLVIYQNVTIGSKTDGIYPHLLGRNIIYSGSSIIGSSKVGFGTVVGANTFILNRCIDNHSVVVGHELKILEEKNNILNYYFHLE